MTRGRKYVVSTLLRRDYLSCCYFQNTPDFTWDIGWLYTVLTALNDKISFDDALIGLCYNTAQIAKAVAENPYDNRWWTENCALYTFYFEWGNLQCG